MQKFVDRKVEEEKEILEMWGWKKGVAWREENAKDERNEREREREKWERREDLLEKWKKR